MKQITSPIPHLLIEEFFTEYELEHQIFPELKYLTSPTRLHPQIMSNDAEQPFCNRNYVTIEELFKDARQSDILNCVDKIYTKETVSALESINPAFRGFSNCGTQLTTVNYYDNNCYINEHVDGVAWVLLVNLYKEPKQFTGGDLIFNDEDYKVELKNNEAILFPASLLNSITPVLIDNDMPYSGNGLYQITRFFWIHVDHDLGTYYGLEPQT